MFTFLNYHKLTIGIKFGLHDFFALPYLLFLTQLHHWRFYTGKKEIYIQILSGIADSPGFSGHRKRITAFIRDVNFPCSVFVYFYTYWYILICLYFRATTTTWFFSPSRGDDNFNKLQLLRTRKTIKFLHSLIEDSLNLAYKAMYQRCQPLFLFSYIIQKPNSKEINCNKQEEVNFISQ